ncbi:hypothetical protein [Pontibacter pudoricolor]|uniref:hypothetical protein n=1 Tax=Pontibacter pudoricolor TaxID=2694930 RepID=UPI0013919DA7|nr:hypothetical protein [Pontibacter pudoricolor]
MKQIIACLLGFVLFIMLFSSCGKENEAPADILLSATWKPGMQDKNPATNPPGKVRYFAVLTCQQDDIYHFDAKGTLTINQGTTKCNAGEPTIATLPYTYNRTTKELIIDGMKYTVAEESGEQVKYYAPTASATEFEYLIFLLHKN